jgi:hypothetical protein
MVMMMPKEGGQPVPGSSPARPPENRFEIRGVTPGAYILRAQVGGGNQQAVAFQDVQVAGNHVDGIVLNLSPGFEVQGTVKIEDTTQPIEMPNLSVGLRAEMPGIGAPPRSRVSPDLRFAVRNVFPMRYTVTVSGLPENCYVKSIQFGGQDVTDSPVEFTGSAPLHITLSAAAAEVSAAVTDKDGRTVPGALVALIPESGTATRASSANETGGVTFRGLKPGAYRLFAFEDIPPGAYMDPEFLKPFEGRGESVKLDASARQALQLRVIPAAETDK